tara:strand:- start:1464 stop:2372 length:909 start_codon:yes stop_codon:yes gene_type:complete
MNEHFIKPFNSMHNFSVFNVTKEFTIQLHGEDILVDRGLYLADGSTRAESKRQLDSGQNHIGYDPEHTVVTTIYDIDNPKSYMGEYYSMDSSEAVENGADKIRGSIRLLEMSLTSKKGLSGQWGTALNASYPGETDTDRYLKMGYFKYQILMLDEHSMWNTTEKELQTQHFYCACFMAAKMYSQSSEQETKFKNIITKLSRLDKHTIKTGEPKWSGSTALIYQLVYGALPKDPGKEWYPIENHKRTGLSTWNPVISFLLYCLELEMQDKRLDHVKGFKESNWKNLYTETKEEMESYFPTRVV